LEKNVEGLYDSSAGSSKMKPTIPEVLERFRAYHEIYPGWGSLHIVLDDGNVKDSNVAFCRNYALAQNDEEGVELADILLQMSETQRLKLGEIA
jgi:hypothetical protein